MNHIDLLTNQEFLKELKKRLPNFNKKELIFLGKIMLMHNPEQEKLLEFLEVNYPETLKLLKGGIQRLEKQENTIKVTVYRCLGCRDLILVKANEKHENICPQCFLENKKNQ